MNYWIKSRYNPQLGTFFTKMGQMTKKDAKECEKSLYGSNVMLSFKTVEEYEEKIKELTKAGNRIQ